MKIFDCKNSVKMLRSFSLPSISWSLGNTANNLEILAFLKTVCKTGVNKTSLFPGSLERVNLHASMLFPVL